MGGKKVAYIKDSENEVLNVFGKALITEVRDRAFENAQKTINGEMKGQMSKTIGEILKKVNRKERDAIIHLCAMTIGDTISNFFDMLGGDIHLMLQQGDQTYDLFEISDGLYGDMLGENGWIEKYSRYKFEKAIYY
jgi:hypothetical protein